jgi:hypothetical protein
VERGFGPDYTLGACDDLAIGGPGTALLAAPRSPAKVCGGRDFRTSATPPHRKRTLPLAFSNAYRMFADGLRDNVENRFSAMKSSAAKSLKVLRKLVLGDRVRSDLEISWSNRLPDQRASSLPGSAKCFSPITAKAATGTHVRGGPLGPASARSLGGPTRASARGPGGTGPRFVLPRLAGQLVCGQRVRISVV